MKRTFWALALAVLAATCMAQGVEVEFLTPRIVHIVKYATTEHAKKTSLVVTAKPETVMLTRRGSTTSSADLTVRIDETSGCVTFLSPKGKVLLREIFL